MENLLEGAFDFAYVFKTVKTRWYYYVALGVFIILLFSFFFFKKQPKRNNLSNTQKIVYTSILAALATVLNIFDIRVSGELKISFIASVGFIAGYLLGGGIGFAVCFIGDLLGEIINPSGPYNPIIGIGTGLWGLIFGIAFAYFKGNCYVKLLVSSILGFILISAGVNTVGFCLMYPTRNTFETLLPLLPLKLITVAVNFAVCSLLLRIFPKILPKDKFNL